MALTKTKLSYLEERVNIDKVEGVVIDALHEILPHLVELSIPDIAMAFVVMFKSSLIGMNLTDAEKDQAKLLFDDMYPEVLVEKTHSPSPPSNKPH